jgi:hypothetical protein
MTYERYLVLALQFMVSILEQRRIPVLDASREQAWNAFLVVFARVPDSLLVQNYYQHGVHLRSDFADVWQVFQTECLERRSQQWER